MTEATLERARAGDESAFRALTEPHRRELQVHCYRILGSVQDAEDLVQETLLAAWRGLGGFEGRASLRSWLYRIATNRCLNALRDGARRPDVAAGGQSAAPAPEPTRLQRADLAPALPRRAARGRARRRAAGPDARSRRREAVGARLRLRASSACRPTSAPCSSCATCSGYRAAEVAEMLGSSEASVNSALQRARAALDAAPEREVGGALPDSPAERDVLARFADAFEARRRRRRASRCSPTTRGSACPPSRTSTRATTAIAAFLRTRSIWTAGRGIRLVPTRANGQPAFAYYLGDPQAGIARAAGLFVLALDGGAISDDHPLRRHRRAALLRAAAHAPGLGPRRRARPAGGLSPRACRRRRA